MSDDSPLPPGTKATIVLDELCRAVAARFPGEAACIPATALIIAAAASFDITLYPQPVSIWSGDPEGQSATGFRARDFGLSLGGTIARDSTEDTGDWFREVGHMIAVSPEHNRILDPTLGQFGRPGAPGPHLVLSVDTTQLPDGDAWAAELNGWYVRYWPASNPGWESEFGTAMRLIVPLHLAAVIAAVRSALRIT